MAGLPWVWRERGFACQVALDTSVGVALRTPVELALLRLALGAISFVEIDVCGD